MTRLALALRRTDMPIFYVFSPNDQRLHSGPMGPAIDGAAALAKRLSKERPEHLYIIGVGVGSYRDGRPVAPDGSQMPEPSDPNWSERVREMDPEDVPDVWPPPKNRPMTEQEKRFAQTFRPPEADE